MLKHQQLFSLTLHGRHILLIILLLSMVWSRKLFFLPIPIYYIGNEVDLKIIDNQIAVVSMQDKENRNMFSENIIVGLMAKFDEIRRNENIKAVIVTGCDNIFSMGGTKKLRSRVQEVWKSLHCKIFTYFLKPYTAFHWYIGVPETLHQFDISHFLGYNKIKEICIIAIFKA